MTYLMLYLHVKFALTSVLKIYAYNYLQK